MVNLFLKLMLERSAEIVFLRTDNKVSFLDSILGSDKLEHGIDCNESEDETADLGDDYLAEEDGLDSDREYIRGETQGGNRSEAPRAHGYSSEAEEILSVQNLPGSVNFGFKRGNSTASLRNQKSKCEIGVQADLDDYFS